MIDTIAEVIVFAPIQQTLSYIVPQELQSNLQPGFLVKISLGRKISLGIVKRIFTSSLSDFPYSLKPILSSVYDCPIISDQMLNLYEWMSKYYVSDMFSIIDMTIPSPIRKKMQIKLDVFLELSHDFCKLQHMKYPIDKKKLPKQYEAFEYILLHKRVSKKDFQKLFSTNIITALLKKNLIYETFQRSERIAFSKYDKTKSCDFFEPTITLTAEQNKITDTIFTDIKNNNFSVHALNGVTGSGKTEVYIDLIQRIINNGGSVLYLVPEITIASQILFRLRDRLANYCPVYIWHSGLSDGEKRDAWMHAIQNQSTIIIGTRSALFVPQNNLKLIIVDEEHEASYKQNEHPRYNARDVAIMKAKTHSAVCILGSATLSFETIENINIGKYKSHTLLSSYYKASTAISIVNMLDEPRGNLISQRLNYEIAQCLSENKQAILFLNRRGFARTVFCKNCSTIIMCPKCNVPMIFHKHDNNIRCHLCGFSEIFSSQCKICRKNSITYCGIGTQRAEDILYKLYPSAKIARIDSDVLVKKYEYIEIFQKFKNREIDILIGTQMLSKSLDFDNVKLIGVLNADLGLNIPNFRANEHSLQLLLQLSGRAGRRTEDGKIVIQTHIPQHEVFDALKNNSYQEYAKSEMQIRKDFFYPPFCRLIHILFESEDEQQTKIIAHQFYSALYNFCNENNLSNYISIAQPIEPFFKKINNKHRYSLLIKTTKVMVLNSLLKQLRDEFYKKNEVKIIIDIDPIDIC